MYILQLQKDFDGIGSHTPFRFLGPTFLIPHTWTWMDLDMALIPTGRVLVLYGELMTVSEWSYARIHISSILRILTAEIITNGCCRNCSHLHGWPDIYIESADPML